VVEVDGYKKGYKDSSKKFLSVRGVSLSW